MKEISYQSFSLKTHQKNWGKNRPNVCQFELTFLCGLRCKHCYTDCYNTPGRIKQELDAKKIKSILDKVYSAGAVWLCLTGGDPLTRKDFPEIYSYAKSKGFIITLFTNAYSMTEELADYLRKNPPFVIEITLNAVRKKTYEKMSQVRGSFEKAMEGIRMMTSRGLPLKIKTHITKDNLEELPEIRDFIESLGLKIKLNSILHARLDKDLTPCSLRITPQEIMGLSKRLGNKGDKLQDDDCRSMPESEKRSPSKDAGLTKQKADAPLFPCPIGSGGLVYVDPYGNLVPCICIREPKVNLCRENIDQARNDILTWVRSRTFTTDSKCKTCQLSGICHRCPGKTMIEKGSLEAEVDWFCDLARSMEAASS